MGSGHLGIVLESVKTENTNSTKLTKLLFKCLQHEIPQATNTYNTLELLMMGIVVPEIC